MKKTQSFFYLFYKQISREFLPLNTVLKYNNKFKEMENIKYILITERITVKNSPMILFLFEVNF